MERKCSARTHLNIVPDVTVKCQAEIRGMAWNGAYQVFMRRRGDEIASEHVLGLTNRGLPCRGVYKGKSEITFPYLSPFSPERAPQ